VQAPAEYELVVNLKTAGFSRASVPELREKSRRAVAPPARRVNILVAYSPRMDLRSGFRSRSRNDVAANVSANRTDGPNIYHMPPRLRVFSLWRSNLAIIDPEPRTWRDLAEHFGPYTTCYNCFARWRRAGVWDHLMRALTAGHDAAVQMIDMSIVRVHQHGASSAGKGEQGRSRGGLTTQLPAIVDTGGLPLRLALTTGRAVLQQDQTMSAGRYAR
jgi:hypothetical protein